MFGNKKLNTIIKNQEKILREIAYIKKNIIVANNDYNRAIIEDEPIIEDYIKETKPKKAKTIRKENRHDELGKNRTMMTLDEVHSKKAFANASKNKRYSIEYEPKNKTDMTLMEFAEVMKIGAPVLRSRLNTLEKEGATWITNDNFIYYIRRPNTNYLVKMLTKPAQDYLIRRYGIGGKKYNRGA